MPRLNRWAGCLTAAVLLVMAIGTSGISSAIESSDGTSLPGRNLPASQAERDATADDAPWIVEKSGQHLPLDLEFVDEKGAAVRLGEFIDRPTIFLPIYFTCPNICSRSLANLAASLKHLRSVPGKEYRVIALSFNEAEGYEKAAQAKRNYLKIVGDDFPAESWRFLTGSRQAIQEAMNAVGFRFKKVDDETFIHAAALMIIADDGKIIRYVYGSFLAGDIDMGLADAASGRPSMSVKRLLAFCFNYDPSKSMAVFQQVKIGVLLVFAVLMAFVFIYFKRKRSKAADGWQQ